jgi:metallo-beta-lactamase class B
MTRAAVITLILSFAAQAFAQALPPNLPTKEQLADDNNLFIALAKKALK